MTETDLNHFSRPKVPSSLTAAFVRPSWAQRPKRLGDSTPRVDTGELRRPIRTSDSTPQISTGDLLRPRWAAKAS